MTAEENQRPKKGERYVVRREFPASILTTWFAPFTGGGKKTIPIGLEFVIENEPNAGAVAATALPDPYESWERELVDPSEREAEKYSGYYLVIRFDALYANCECINAGTI